MEDAGNRMGRNRERNYGRSNGDCEVSCHDLIACEVSWEGIYGEETIGMK